MAICLFLLYVVEISLYCSHILYVCSFVSQNFASSPRSEVSLRARRSKTFKIITRYFALMLCLLNLKIKITAKYRRPKRHGLALLVFKFALPLWRSKNFLLFDKFCLNFSSYQILPTQQNLKPKSKIYKISARGEKFDCIYRCYPLLASYLYKIKFC